MYKKYSLANFKVFICYREVDNAKNFAEIFILFSYELSCFLYIKSQISFIISFFLPFPCCLSNDKYLVSNLITFLEEPPR